MIPTRSTMYHTKQSSLTGSDTDTALHINDVKLIARELSVSMRGRWRPV